MQKNIRKTERISLIHTESFNLYVQSANQSELHTRGGAYAEMNQEEISFKPYAYKYFDGKEARLSLISF
jgi:hypothetical protein